MTETRMPRHAGPTREVPLVGYTPKHDAEMNPPLRPASPNAAADGTKVHSWPVQAMAPTKALPPSAPRPYLPPPNVVVEPPIKPADAVTLRAACLVTAGVVSLIAAVWAVVEVIVP